MHYHETNQNHDLREKKCGFPTRSLFADTLSLESDEGERSTTLWSNLA